MDQVVQEIIKRYREYKKRLRQSLATPLPTALATAFALLASPLASHSASVNSKLIPYYGSEFYQRLNSGDRDAELLADIEKVLVSQHLRKKGEMDVITPHCDTANRDCYGQKPIGYKAARRVIMGELHFNAIDNGVDEVYCQREYTKTDFSSGPFPGPNVTPNEKVLNVEHTWPQSRFNPLMNNGMQKSDLHHLFPADSEMNRLRGNMRFGEVDVPTRTLRCSQSKLGEVNGAGGDFFEPPNAHKGNVARALFYFSVRYKLSIDPVEEGFLREWNKLDPVDDAERERNDQIQKIQSNRNPFVDFPDLADSIADF